MRSQPKYSDEDKASALATVAATNIRQAAKLLGIPRSTLKAWVNGSGVSGVTDEMVSDKRSALADKFERIAQVLTGALLDKDKIAKATLSQVAVACGIATDKMNILRNQPTSITRNINVSEKRRYEIAVGQLITEAKKADIEIDRKEAIELLTPHFPNLEKILSEA